MIELPEKFINRMKNLLGDDYTLYENALSQEPIKAFRVNTDKISLKDFNEIDNISSGNIPYCQNGFYLKVDKIGNHPFHHAGMIYVQEPGAMAASECIDINPDWRILDMCAAPGGKSTQLKNKLGEKGVLVSNEIIPSRCKILTGNIERLGLKNTIVTCHDTSRLTTFFPKTFDLIMVDAPCSGEGMFRKDDTAILEWSEENVRKCAVRQEEILENAVKMLKDGGYIIYATCTFSLEENEMIIDSFLKKHSDFEIVKVKDEVIASTCDGIKFNGCLCENIHYSRRFYPHKAKGEGQFMALLHHKGTPSANSRITKKINKADTLVFDFLNDVLEEYDESYVTDYNGNPVYITPDFNVEKGVAFAFGVKIGEIKKNYIQPHHQFFMSLGKNFKRKIELSADSELLSKYLHGEEIEVCCENGWAVVMVNGCAVGGVKVVNGTAKNHYPKGLRIR